jgi:hypothetical protein
MLDSTPWHLVPAMNQAIEKMHLGIFGALKKKTNRPTAKTDRLTNTILLREQDKIYDHWSDNIASSRDNNKLNTPISSSQTDLVSPYQ